MINDKPYTHTKRWFLIRLAFAAALFFCSVTLYAQEKPPRPVNITVDLSQGLIFGAFSQTGSGGTVIVSATGSRSSTGSIILLNLGYPFAAAVYNVDAEPGTLVTLMNGSDITLTGTGGGSMTLHIGASNLGSPFVTTARPPARTVLRIGGTLTVGTSLASPPGNYSGMFNVTFVQQ